jgi:diguanylate cyclase (GGDEF)-like protein
MPSLSLRPILIIPFVAEIIAVVGLTGYISFQNGQKAVNHLSAKLQNEVSYRVAEHLNNYFAEAAEITEHTRDAINIGLLKPDNLPQVGRFLWHQAKLHPASYIGYGLATGEYAGAGYLGGESSLTISETSAKTRFKNYNFNTDSQGNRLGKPQIMEYKFQKEIWYTQAMESGEMSWVNPYAWEDNPQMISIAISRPIQDANGNIIGVIGVDLLSTKVSDFLKNIEISPHGEILIINRQGYLMASSGKELPFQVINGKSKNIKVKDSPDLLTRSIGIYLQSKFPNLSNINSSYQGEFFNNNQRQFIRINPWNNQLGLDWLVVVIVPEKDFMDTIYKNMQYTITLCLLALVVAIAGGFLTSHYIIQPIIETIEAAESLSKGKWQQLLVISGSKELASLQKSFNRMAEQLHDYFAQLEHLAYHDFLTGLPNQRQFRSILSNKVNQKLEEKNLFAVLFLDLDYFKLVNDSLGHLVGDLLLIQVAARLKQCVGSIDSVFRFGGDEFAIILNKLTAETQAIEVADNICQSLQKPFNLNDNEVFINTSIGIVFNDFSSQTVDDLIRNSDLALYHAKNNGKGTYEVFDAEMYEQVSRRMSLETDLRKALERREIEVYYQPIIDIINQEIVGFEALMRWRHSQLGSIAPDVFIPIAEESGLIIDLGWWLAEEACSQIKAWQKKFPYFSSLKISINFSAKQFFQSNFVDKIEHIIKNNYLDPNTVSIEITESLFIKYTEVMQKKMEFLNALGVKLSLDDFGIGYSCLSYLKNFSLDTIKIDRSFVKDLSCNPHNLAIVEAIALLARQLNMDIVAEGVETEEQMSIISSIGCYQAQGYLFSPPVTASVAEKLLEKAHQNQSFWGFQKKQKLTA